MGRKLICEFSNLLFGTSHSTVMCSVTSSAAFKLYFGFQAVGAIGGTSNIHPGSSLFFAQVEIFINKIDNDELARNISIKLVFMAIKLHNRELIHDEIVKIATCPRL